MNIQILSFHYDVPALHEICVCRSQYLFLFYFWSLSNSRQICHSRLRILTTQDLAWIERTFVEPCLFEKPALLLIQQPVHSVIDFSPSAPPADEGVKLKPVTVSFSPGS